MPFFYCFHSGVCYVLILAGVCKDVLLLWGYGPRIENVLVLLSVTMGIVSHCLYQLESIVYL